MPAWGAAANSPCVCPARPCGWHRGEATKFRAACRAPDVRRLGACSWPMTNRDAADSTALVLENAGHQVWRTFCGQEALAVALRERPEVLILDIGMPDMNGYEVAERVRAEPWGKHAALVAVTGWGQERDRQRARVAGFDHHLTKPVDPALLEALLVQLVTDPTIAGTPLRDKASGSSKGGTAQGLRAGVRDGSQHRSRTSRSNTASQSRNFRRVLGIGQSRIVSSIYWDTQGGRFRQRKINYSKPVEAAPIKSGAKRSSRWCRLGERRVLHPSTPQHFHP